MVIQPILEKTPYEFIEGRKPNISIFLLHMLYFKDWQKKKLGKIDAKDIKGIFLGYSSSSKGYKMFNLQTNIVEESAYVALGDAKS